MMLLDTKTKRKAQALDGIEKVDKLFQDIEGRNRANRRDEARIRNIQERTNRFEVDGEFEKSYYRPEARTLRARKSILSFGKSIRKGKWKESYEQAYTVFLAIVREWRRRDSLKGGIEIAPNRLLQITGLSARRISELLTLLKGKPLKKNGRLYPAPRADDGRPFLEAIPGKGRAPNRYKPHLP